jgi:hypothetical protein
MTILARECIDVDALGLGSPVGRGRGRVPAVESRDSHQLGHAVAIEIGRVEDAISGRMGRTQRVRPEAPSSTRTPRKPAFGGIGPK